MAFAVPAGATRDILNISFGAPVSTRLADRCTLGFHLGNDRGAVSGRHLRTGGWCVELVGGTPSNSLKRGGIQESCAMLLAEPNSLAFNRLESHSLFSVIWQGRFPLT